MSHEVFLMLVHSYSLMNWTLESNTLLVMLSVTSVTPSSTMNQNVCCEKHLLNILSSTSLHVSRCVMRILPVVQTAWKSWQQSLCCRQLRSHLHRWPLVKLSPQRPTQLPEDRQHVCVDLQLFFHFIHITFWVSNYIIWSYVLSTAF